MLIFATRYVKDQIKALPILYFELVYDESLYDLDFIRHEFTSKIQNYHQKCQITTNKDSFIYIFFQNYDNLQNLKLIQDLCNLQQSQMYFINSSCPNGSVIQYIKTYQTFQKLFLSNSVISKQFPLLYPLYSNRTLDPFYYILFLQKRHITIDSKKLFKYQTAFNFLVNLFSSSFVLIDEVIQRLHEMKFSLIEEQLKINNIGDLEEFCLIIKDSSLQSLEEINMLSELIEIFSKIENGEKLLTQLFNQDNLKNLSQFYESLSYNDLITFTQLLQNMHNYTGSFVPDINVQYQNIVIISISSPFLSTFSYPTHYFKASMKGTHIYLYLSMGSYTTSVLIESLFLNPDPKGLSQNRFDIETQKFSSIYSKLDSPERYVPQLCFYQTNSFQQIPFRQKNEKTPLDLKSILSTTTLSYLQSKTITIYEPEFFEDPKDKDEWSDVIYSDHITYFNGCPMYYHDRDDKILDIH